MNYLNEEYKNLSDWDKKISCQILSSFYKKRNKKLMMKSTSKKWDCLFRNIRDRRKQHRRMERRN